MNITYFKDTDTLLVHFNENTVTETKDLNENTLVDLDKDGNLVAMTIEHDKQQTDIDLLSFKQVQQTV